MSILSHKTQSAAMTRLPVILLAEDSLTSAAMIARVLNEHYTLVHARNGEEAWKLLEHNHEIELVLTDIEMPGITGQQLLKRTRASSDPRIRNLPVIVMTTADDSTEKHMAFLNGANDFLNKPLDTIELRARINVHHHLARTIHELEASRLALAEQANTDTLTKLKNRRFFYDRSVSNLEECRRLGKDMSVLMLDIDHFKRINDIHGHHAGDEVLVHISRLLINTTRNAEKNRPSDTIARFGGEEFAVLLPDTNRLDAAVLAERIRMTIEKGQITVGEARIQVTVSIGIATLAAEAIDSIDQLLNIADRRLYLAKNSGRNRICVSDDGRSSFA